MGGVLCKLSFNKFTKYSGVTTFDAPIWVPLSIDAALKTAPLSEITLSREDASIPPTTESSKFAISTKGTAAFRESASTTCASYPGNKNVSGGRWSSQGLGIISNIN